MLNYRLVIKGRMDDAEHALERHGFHAWHDISELERETTVTVPSAYDLTVKLQRWFDEQPMPGVMAEGGRVLGYTGGETGDVLPVGSLLLWNLDPRAAA